MGQDTRVEKHKEYRTSLIKEGTNSLNSSREKLSLSNSDTLPFDTVMESVQQENREIEEMKKDLKKKYVISTCIISGAIVVIAIIVIVAIVIFKR